MYMNVNLPAPIGVMAFLGTVFVLLLLAFVLLSSLVRKRFILTRVSLVVIVVVLAAYIVAMLVFSVTSHNQVLARGEEKHFCEIDCHLAYSVQDVQQVATLGDMTALGCYYIVTIKTRFDEKTISPTRGNSPLHPNSRIVSVIDGDGHTYLPSAGGQRVLESSHSSGTPITTPLRPGDSYTSVFVFDLPAGINDPVLLIREGEWVTSFIIGHENSLAHKKTSLQL